MSSSSVYQSFRCINIISRIFGVMPLKMDPGDQTNGPVCLMSKLDYIYSLVLLIISIAHGILAPFYILHTIMPKDYKQSIFTVEFETSMKPVVNGVGMELEEDEISVLATAMNILNPIMITVSSICSRLVTLTYLHCRLSEFIDILHNTDRLMEVNIKMHMSDSSKTPLQILDKYLLRYFIIIGILVNVYYVFTASAMNSKAGIAWCIVLAFNNLACFSTDMQFIRCACMLEYRFRIINNELKTIASLWHFKRGLVFHYSILSLHSYFLERTHSSTKIKFLVVLTHNLILLVKNL